MSASALNLHTTALAPHSPLTDLPVEVGAHIMSYVVESGDVSCRLTCDALRNFVDAHFNSLAILWQQFKENNPKGLIDLKRLSHSIEVEASKQGKIPISGPISATAHLNLFRSLNTRILAEYQVPLEYAFSSSMAHYEQLQADYEQRTQDQNLRDIWPTLVEKMESAAQRQNLPQLQWSKYIPSSEIQAWIANPDHQSYLDLVNHIEFPDKLAFANTLIVPQEIEKFRAITYLSIKEPSISYNPKFISLESVRQSIVKLQNLRVLYIDGIPFENDTTLIEQLPNIKLLSISLQSLAKVWKLPSDHSTITEEMLPNTLHSLTIEKIILGPVDEHPRRTALICFTGAQAAGMWEMHPEGGIQVNPHA